MDEICVAQDSMSFADYLNCRIFDLFVHLFHNDGPFVALERLLTEKGCDIGDWIDACTAVRWPTSFGAMVDDFVRDTRGQLHDTADELTAYVERPDILDRHIAGELGNNVLHTYRGRAFAECFAAMVEVAEVAALHVLESNGVATPAVRDFVRAAVAFHVARCEGVLDEQPERDREVTLSHDIPGYLEAGEYRVAESFRLPALRTYRLSLTTAFIGGTAQAMRWLIDHTRQPGQRHPAPSKLVL